MLNLFLSTIHRVSMTAKHRARRPRTDDSNLCEFGEDAVPSPLKPAVAPSPPSTEDARAQGSDNMTAATLKRGEKRSPPPRQGDERPEKRAAGPDTAVKPPKPKPMSPSSLLQVELNDNTPSLSHIAQKDEHRGREMAGQEQSNTSGENNREQEDEDTGAQVKGKALQVNAPPTKLRGSETKKKPAVERSWSYADELKILNALVEHARSHDGALLDSSYLLANITFDKSDANEEKLTDKIRKLKRRYDNMRLQGCPSNPHARQLFNLFEKLWGQVDEDEQVEPTARDFSAMTSRDFSALSKLYPHLAKEVKAYAEAHRSRDMIIARFMTIGDEKARDLDAKCKKQQCEALKLELGQASLINELLSALSSPTV